MALILVTGASRGLGRNTAAALADAGHDVVIHVRDAARLVPAAPGDRWAGVVEGDLSDLEQTRVAADQANAFGRFDAVIHNAGALDRPAAVSVNAIAPFVLTALMEKPGRLVYLSSGMHRGGSTDLDRLTRGTGSYSDSKLWVTALAMAFASRWDGTVSHAVDPGWVPTDMGGRGAPDDLTAGHETQVWLATAPEVSPATGGYWFHRRTESAHRAAQQPEFQRQLIETLESLTGVRLG
jgi:NAD(P)-dependent dehydrogenase (short-subunit alcohol dehydrogenase family)